MKEIIHGLHNLYNRITLFEWEFLNPLVNKIIPTDPLPLDIIISVHFINKYYGGEL